MIKYIPLRNVKIYDSDSDAVKKSKYKEQKARKDTSSTKLLDKALSSYDGIGILIDNFDNVIVDVDDLTEADKLLQLLEDYSAEDGVKGFKFYYQKTKNGIHIMFKNKYENNNKPIIKNNGSNLYSPSSIVVDYRTKGGYIVTKVNNEFREWYKFEKGKHMKMGTVETWVPDFYDTSTIPDFLVTTIQYKDTYPRLCFIDEGGRNSTLTRYVGYFANPFQYNFESARKLTKTVNKILLPEPLDSDELDTILESMRANIVDAFQNKDTVKDYKYFINHYNWSNESFINYCGTLLVWDKTLNKFVDKNIYEGIFADEFGKMTDEIMNNNESNEVSGYIRRTFTRHAKEIYSPERYYKYGNKLVDEKCNIIDIKPVKYIAAIDSRIGLDMEIFDKDLIRDIDKFILTICDHDVSKKIFMFELLSTMLVPNNDAQHIYFIHGSEGANGKSALTNFLSKAIGEENLSVVSIQEFTQEFKTEALETSIINIGGDADAHYTPSVRTLKGISGADTIQINRKGKSIVSMKLCSTQVQIFNELPTVASDKGFARRVRVMTADASLGKHTEAGREFGLLYRRCVEHEQFKECFINLLWSYLMKFKDNDYEHVYCKNVEVNTRKYLGDNNRCSDFFNDFVLSYSDDSLERRFMSKLEKDILLYDLYLESVNRFKFDKESCLSNKYFNIFTKTDLFDIYKLYTGDRQTKQKSFTRLLLDYSIVDDDKSFIVRQADKNIYECNKQVIGFSLKFLDNLKTME